MKYLTPQDIMVMHAQMADETGGLHGIRDTGLLLSLVERLKTAFGGKEFYPTVFAKAAVYFESLGTYHVFADGNKRTAIVASARFLFLNGFVLVASNKEVERFTLKVAARKVDLKNIQAWLKNHSEKL